MRAVALGVVVVALLGCNRHQVIKRDRQLEMAMDGHDYELRTTAGHVFEARVMGRDAAGNVMIAAPDGRQYLNAPGSIQSLRRTSRGRGALHGFLWTAGVVGSVALAMSLSGSVSEDCGLTCKPGDHITFIVGAGALFGAIFGIPIGILVGSDTVYTFE